MDKTDISHYNIHWFNNETKRKRAVEAARERKEKMKLIVGLGNPTKEYENTRHNIGFMAVDALAAEYGITVTTLKHKALIGKGMIEGEKVILAKPVTYMNLSGEAVREISDYYKIPAEDVIVIYDDISLDVGFLRIRKKGSAGGHNGMKSIIAHLGTEDFPRVKVGIGEKRPGQDLADYVLGRFPKEDLEALKKVLEDVKKAIALMVWDDIGEAMNLYNKKKEKKKKEKAVKKEDENASVKCSVGALGSDHGDKGSNERKEISPACDRLCGESELSSGGHTGESL